MQAYSIVYGFTYNFHLASNRCVLLAPFIGNVPGVLLYFCFFKPRYTAREARICARDSHATIFSEASLPGVIVAVHLVFVDMFRFTGAARPSVHWIARVLSAYLY
jgi:hypothetical protein